MKKILAAAAVAVLAAGCASSGGYPHRGYHGHRYPQQASSYPSGSYSSQPSVDPRLGQAAGAVAGGLLGAQVGKGNGRVAAAAVGAAPAPMPAASSPIRASPI